MSAVSVHDWINLSDAADLLGVHPSTVRQWADSGELLSQRTKGGHRRFSRIDLEAWMRTRRHGPPHGASLVVQSALGRARMEMSEGQLTNQSWYKNVPDAARAAHRDAGHRLLNLLQQYLGGGDRELLLAEARQIGANYYALGQDSQLSLSDNVRAFLHFQDHLIESVVQMVETVGSARAQSLAELYRLTAQFTNEVLIALIAAYEINSTRRAPEQ